MDSQAVDAVLASLAPDDYGWRADLGPAAGSFLGRPLRLEVQTREVPSRRRVPRPSAAEVALVRLVLGGLPRVLPAAEREFAAYNADDPDAAAQAADPHVWVHRDTVEEAGPSRWSLVVGRAGDEDYGCHLEFDGLEFRDCWAGD